MGTRFFCKQRANTLEFLLDEIDFLLLGLGLSEVSLDFILQLRFALPELRFLSARGLAGADRKAARSAASARPASELLSRARSSSTLGNTIWSASSRSASRRA